MIKKESEKLFGFKKFKEFEEEKKNFFKNKKEREVNFAEEVIKKTNISPEDIDNQLPLPADYVTFEKINKICLKEKSTKSQKKGLGFGVGDRIPLSDKDKWLKKVQRYNMNSTSNIDASIDNIPGPSAYSLISHWAGKKPRKEPEKKVESHNYFKVVTKGPELNPYYACYD